LTIFVALWRYSPMFTAAAVAGVIISAIYGLRSAARVFFGEPSQTFEEVAAKHPVSDIGWGERIPALILLATLLFIGFWPRSIARSIEAGVSAPPTVVAFASP
jgi:NADH-quinone oxidoreductase subunit M